MIVVGVPAGDTGEPHDRVAVDADEPPGGADAALLVAVFEDCQGLLLGQVAAVQRRPLRSEERALQALQESWRNGSCFPRRPQTERLPASRRP